MSAFSPPAILVSLHSRVKMEKYVGGCLSIVTLIILYNVKTIFSPQQARRMRGGKGTQGESQGDYRCVTVEVT